jgi:hypothetical protein
LEYQQTTIFRLCQRFEIGQNYAEKFEVHKVGGKCHLELWVPAEELDKLNRHIIGKIEVVASYFGNSFQGKYE